MSSLAWIDFDEAERQRAQRILALFQERETRDELGLGGIRDSIADHLFPGTSTIQTRPRYMLFVPWLFRRLESRATTTAQLADEGRRLETALMGSLLAGGETIGVIGREAGSRLKRLPSSVYWAGLNAWGVRRFPGSIDSLFETLAGRARLRRAPGEGSADAQVHALWHPRMPDPPEDLLERATFHLTADEAEFLVDCLVATHPTALLTLLAREGDDAECDFIWMHPHFSSFPDSARRLVRHGEMFSGLMHGASLLYNLALSELRQREEWIEVYRGRLADWSRELDISDIRAWSLEEFWVAVQHPAHVVLPASRRFVREWRDLVLEQPTQVGELAAALRLVEERERRLKGSQSRFTNRAVRDRWMGASGVDRLNFRWNRGQMYLRDLAHAA